MCRTPAVEEAEVEYGFAEDVDNEIWVNEGDSVVNNLVEEGLYDDFPQEDGDPDVVWAQDSTGHWTLCVECICCFSLMPYPGQAHNCPVGDVLPGPVVHIHPVCVSATTLANEGGRLECYEDLNSSDESLESCPGSPTQDQIDYSDVD